MVTKHTHLRVLREISCRNSLQSFRSRIIVRPSASFCSPLQRSSVLSFSLFQYILQFRTEMKDRIKAAFVVLTFPGIHRISFVLWACFSLFIDPLFLNVALQYWCMSSLYLLQDRKCVSSWDKDLIVNCYRRCGRRVYVYHIFSRFPLNKLCCVSVASDICLTLFE